MQLDMFNVFNDRRKNLTFIFFKRALCLRYHLIKFYHDLWQNGIQYLLKVQQMHFVLLKLQYKIYFRILYSSGLIFVLALVYVS